MGGGCIAAMHKFFPASPPRLVKPMTHQWVLLTAVAKGIDLACCPQRQIKQL
jgi:hypothetical protein